METRLEHDTFGDIEVPSGRLWGAQTQRALQHFAISSETMPREVIAALALLKGAAARGEDGPSGTGIAGNGGGREDAAGAGCKGASTGPDDLPHPAAPGTGKRCTCGSCWFTIPTAHCRRWKRYGKEKLKQLPGK